MGLTRREAMKLGVAIGGLSPLGWMDEALAQYQNCPPADEFRPVRRSPQIQRFFLPLVTPNVLDPVKTDSDTDYYRVKIRADETYFDVPLAGSTNPVRLRIPYWGYEGEFLGPTIVQEQGRYSCVQFINQLDVIQPITPTERDANGCFLRGDAKPRPQYNDMVIHLHGMNSVPCYDGYALDIIPPGYYKNYIYPNDELGTFWYHDHAIDHTAENVQRGLAGMYLVVDRKRDQALNIPILDGYDIPLILQDREFEPDPDDTSTPKQVYRDRCFYDRGHNSFYGDVICVNGVPFPYLEVEPRPYRFRILNASPSRNYRLALSLAVSPANQAIPNADKTVGGKITVIGNDQDLLPAPIELLTSCQTLSIGMAERYDVMIDFSVYQPGEHVYLRNIGSTGMRDLDDRVSTIMQFRIKAGSTPIKMNLPAQLNKEFRVLAENQAPVTTRRFRFEQGGGKWVINGKGWDANRIDAKPTQNAYEIWEFVNPGSGWIHPVHPHLIKFQILSRNGKKPPCHQRGWKDVVMVHEFETVRVMMKFKPHKGIYMMHCHNLVHEDHMMMTQFEVIGEGNPANHPCSRSAEPMPGNGQLPELKRTETIPETDQDIGTDPQSCETKPSCSS
jgi:spore coat protein A, manganese oxidase